MTRTPQTAWWVPTALRPLGRRALVRYRFLGLRANDALLVSYPKSGSTWLRFLLAQILGGSEADYGSIRDTVAPVGRHRGAPAILPGGGRMLRTHEPLAPYRGRMGQPVVYLIRDPRDVCLSYFNHRRRQGATSEFPSFAQRFLDGRVDGVGSWHRHAETARDFASGPQRDCLCLRYEDLNADPVVRLLELVAFLGLEADEGVVSRAVADNTRDRMREREDPSFLSRVGMGGASLPPERRSFAELAPESLRACFDRICGPEMQAWGYPTPGRAPLGKRGA